MFGERVTLLQVTLLFGLAQRQLPGAPLPNKHLPLTRARLSASAAALYLWP